MFDIALTVRDNPEWLNAYLLSYKKYTSNPYSYKITIVDTSIESNKKNTRLILSNFKDLNIELIDGNREQHYHKTWIDAIKNTDCEFVLLTHVDIVFLMNDWDSFVVERLNNNETLISVSVRTKQFPESVWICAEKDILIESKFDPAIIDDKFIEHGLVKIYHDKTNEGSFYINEVKRLAPLYGDIAVLENKEFIYHNYYSSRIKQDTICPIPEGPESNYISNREDFDTTINRIRNFLDLNEEKYTLQEYLINN